VVAYFFGPSCRDGQVDENRHTGNAGIACRAHAFDPRRRCHACSERVNGKRRFGGRRRKSGNKMTPGLARPLTPKSTCLSAPPQITRTDIPPRQTVLQSQSNCTTQTLTGASYRLCLSAPTSYPIGSTMGVGMYPPKFTVGMAILPSTQY